MNRGLDFGGSCGRSGARRGRGRRLREGGRTAEHHRQGGRRENAAETTHGCLHTIGFRRYQAYRAIALIFALGLVALLAGCGPRDASLAGPRPLEVLVSSETETLDPRYAVDSVSHRASRLIHSGLTTLDPDTLEPRPHLAARLALRDAQTLEVELRPGLTFHSGAPLRPEDVVASLDAFRDPVVSPRTARIFEAIASVERTGDHALLVRLKRPHATILTDLEFPILRADQAALPPRPGGDLDGLGPYRVALAKPGEVVLAPARGGPVTALRGVVVRTVRDENARALRLLAGRADVAVNVLSPTLLPALEGRSALALTRRPGANVTYLLLRVDRAPFDELRARRAVSVAIDRRALTDGLLAGAAQPASGALPPALWAHAPLAPLPFDLPLARSDVAALRGLRFTLLTTPDRVRLSIARTIAQYVRDAGAEVDVTSLELGALIARLTAGDFDAAILNMPELTEPNVLRLFMHSASVPPSASNRGRIRDPRIDALLDAAAAELDRSVRRLRYAELEAHLRETHLFVPLWYESQVAVTSERARSFIPSAEGRWADLATIP